MQANIALGLVELSSIARGIEALDAMCKAAGVKPEVHQAISKGKYPLKVKKYELREGYALIAVELEE